MRTTLNIDDRLLEGAREKARREGKTLSAVVEEALRAAMLPGASRPTAPYRVKPIGAGESLVPIGSFGKMLAVMDEIEIAEAEREGRSPRFR
jgi:hypothetical protein